MTVSKVDPGMGRVMGQYDPKNPSEYLVGAQESSAIANRYGTARGKTTGQSMVKASEASLERMKVRQQSLEKLAQNGRGFSYSQYINWRRTYWASSLSKDQAARDLTVQTHELGHAIHHRANWKTPSSVTVNGKKYTGTELTEELRRGTSLYGNTDTATIRPAFKLRAETFAENFVFYVTAGEKYKKQYPVSYEWTRLIVEDARKNKKF